MSRTDVMTATERANRRLLVIAEQLVTEYDDVPTGSVLRCLSRAVGAARAKACAPDEVPELAERLARDMLGRRLEPWVPGPRPS
ncbi:MAG: hypothetical protein U0R80_16725 [Nocardioidaceae bacterium]